MSDQTPLERLAELCGIGHQWTDIWGKQHTVSDKTKRALLRAMGLPVDQAGGIDATLSDQQARPWRRPLPPVHVLAAPAPRPLPICLPASHCAGTRAWRLIEEGGRRHEGELSPKALEVVAESMLGGERRLRLAFSPPLEPPPGYHRFELELSGAQTAATRLIAAPECCYMPQALRGRGRAWGPNVQLYGLRSLHNWGIGDFSDLCLLVDCCAELGADLVGLSPVHALFPDDPEHCGPYGPSSRRFLNMLFISVEGIAEFAECEAAQAMVANPEFQHRLQALRDAELVDYPEVSALKLPTLSALYQTFRRRHLECDDDRGRAFRAFQAEGGEALWHHALFEALQAHFHRHDSSIWGWPLWPPAYQSPRSDAVQAFAERHREDIEFYQYLQWQAEEQLRAVGERAMERHLGVGLYEDLALSVDRAGAEVWSNQSLYAQGASLGSPPDDLNLRGQDWGLPPLIPQQLIETAYEPFIAALRAGMRHAGALRIDHIMSLMRLFWIPEGRPVAEGAYVRYPFDDLVAILTLESQRNRSLVIGEDLGTVPEALRSALAPRKVLSSRLLYFERSPEGDFPTPGDYPTQALVAASTHDLPTLAGFWEGDDLALRAQLDLFPSAGLRQSQTEQRSHDRVKLLVALEREGLLPEGVSTDPASVPVLSPELVAAIYRYLARTPGKLLAVQLEDVLGQKDQANVPGTSGEHPNWRRRLQRSLEALCQDRRLQNLASAINRERARAEIAEPLEGDDEWIPRATYRLQLNRNFTFRDATALVPYLDALGISHCYVSPYLKARPGSTHGYDIIDHNSLNPEIGSLDDLQRLADVLAGRSMGEILDTVPNHMGVMGADNPWWLGVLENGLVSVYYDFFDIDWEPLKVELQGKVLVPVLGDHYGAVLERGELELVFDAPQGSLALRYFEHVFPVDPKEYPRVLEHRSERLQRRLGPASPALSELRSLVTAFSHLPGRDRTGARERTERRRDKEIHKQRLAALCAGRARRSSRWTLRPAAISALATGGYRGGPASRISVPGGGKDPRRL